MTKHPGKALGMRGAKDHGATMRALAQAAMPEIASMGAALPAAPAMNKGGGCYKKGGVVMRAKGGAGKIRKGEMSKSGAPLPPKVKFRGK